MTFATSEQALEFLANDTPQRYHADAARSLVRASLNGLLAVASGAVGAYCLRVSMSPTAVSPTTPFFLGAFSTLYAASTAREATQLFHEGLEALTFAKRAGQSTTTFLTRENNLRRQIYDNGAKNAIIVRPYADLADVPENTPLNEYAAVNGVSFGLDRARKTTNNIMLMNNYCTVSARTRFGKESVSVDPREAELRLQGDERFVLARRINGDYLITGTREPVTVSDIRGKRTRAIHLERKDLSWTPSTLPIR